MDTSVASPTPIAPPIGMKTVKPAEAERVTLPMAGELGERTYRLATRALGGRVHPPAGAAFMGAGIIGAVAFVAVPQLLFPHGWNNETALVASALLLSFVGVALSFARPNLPRYRRVLARVVRDLYPGFSFEGERPVAEVNQELPACVRAHLREVTHAWGELARPVRGGRARIRSIEGVDDSGESASSEPFVLIEVPLGAHGCAAVGADGYFALSDEQVPGGAVRGVLVTFTRSVARTLLRHGKNDEVVHGEVLGTTLTFDASDARVAVLADMWDEATISELERFFDEVAPGGTVYLARGSLWWPLRHESLAFEQGYRSMYRREAFNEHAAELCDRFAAACHLAAVIA